MTVAPYALLTSQPELTADVIRAAADHIDATRTRCLRPSEAGSALRQDLRRQAADELNRDEYLTGRQTALWEYLRELKPGHVRVEIPPQLRRPSVAAQAAMWKESEHVELREAHAALTAEHSELKQRTAMVEQRFAGAIVLAHQAVAAAAERAVAANGAGEHRARELASLESSASWRITAPLRSLKRMLRRLFRA